MCLGIPGRIVAISDPIRKLATVEVMGVQRQVNIACILNGEPADNLIGAWALIHVGFAMSRINEDEAKLTLDVLRQLGEAQAEVEAMRASERALAV